MLVFASEQARVPQEPYQRPMVEDPQDRIAALLEDSIGCLGSGQDYHQRQRRVNQRGRGNWKNRGGSGGRGGYSRGGVNPRSRLQFSQDAEGDEIMGEISPPQRL